MSEEKRHTVFERGTMIQRRDGYQFDGVVIAAFPKIDGGTLIAVECVAEGARGMVHLFRPAQLLPVGFVDLPVPADAPKAAKS